MKCPKCNNPVNGKPFCTKCGTKLTKRTAFQECDSGENHEDGSFHSSCGKVHDDGYEKTIQYLTEKVNQQPDNPDRYKARADIYSDNDYDKKIIDLTMAIKLDSDNPARYKDRAYAYNDKDFLKKFDDIFDGLVIDPLFSELHICFENTLSNKNTDPSDLIDYIFDKKSENKELAGEKGLAAGVFVDMIGDHGVFSPYSSRSQADCYFAAFLLFVLAYSEITDSDTEESKYKKNVAVVKELLDRSKEKLDSSCSQLSLKKRLLYKTGKWGLPLLSWVLQHEIKSQRKEKLRQEKRNRPLNRFFNICGNIFSCWAILLFGSIYLGRYCLDNGYNQYANKLLSISIVLDMGIGHGQLYYERYFTYYDELYLDNYTIDGNSGKLSPQKELILRKAESDLRSAVEYLPDDMKDDINLLQALAGISIVVDGDSGDYFQKYLNLTTKNRENAELVIKETSKNIRRNPNDFDSYLKRCKAHFEISSYNSAIDDCSVAIEHNNSNAKSYTNRCKAYYMTNNLEKAFSDCTEAINTNSKSSDAYLFRCKIYNDQKKFENAYRDCYKAVRQDTMNFEARKLINDVRRKVNSAE